jgi:hypothetical protein
VFIYPTKTKALNDPGLDDFYNQLIAYHPRILQGDNAFKDVGTLSNLTEALQKSGTKLINSTPYKPSTNGCVERFNKTLKQMIYFVFSQNKNKIWYPIIHDLVKSYNNTYHTVIKTTPYEAYHDKRKRGKVKSEINKQARKMVYNTRTKVDVINEGDYVRLVANEGEYKVNRLKKDIANTYDYDIYKVMTISRASRYNNQCAIIRKYYAYNKRTKKIFKLKGISKAIPRWFDNDPLLQDAFINDKIVFFSSLQKIDIDKLS